MKGYNLFFLKIFLFLVLFGCKDNDDEASDDDLLAIRDASEQAIVDDTILKTFLETHFYNYDDFNLSPNDYFEGSTNFPQEVVLEILNLTFFALFCPFCPKRVLPVV